MVNRNLNLSHQRGVVLIAALVMVLVVSGIAVTLMSNSTVDMKVINAAQDYDEALTRAYADTSRAIYDEIKLNGATHFTTPNLGTEDETVALTAAGAQSTFELVKAPGELLATNCSPRRSANDTASDIKCSRDLRLFTTNSYGKGNRHLVSVIAGIEQESL
ncbi:pilus assembly PilX N-terminal domain-containing protein [Pseudoalteromonas sp. BDTF-M6]|uniref:pilus assembly PilX family protein n=1 Tax=Pseudoalteromonas sp. BDTF-M6 TaxID=2796132 RepID=UPI001BAE7E53|nr:pilus assembly PilX N-terminal domain-containing protein [Pseudoalteromonas sp. BDTF-M6]MBS3796230.1 pilus assembly PilX N-terminal domain-containing protein [Pseudoalteromonas sp. BDTF-M6]